MNNKRSCRPCSASSKRNQENKIKEENLLKTGAQPGAPLSATPSCTKSVQSFTKSVQSCTKSVQSCTKSVHSCTKSVQSCTKSIQSCTKSIQSSTKPVQSSTTPVQASNSIDTCSPSYTRIASPPAPPSHPPSAPHSPHSAALGMEGENNGTETKPVQPYPLPDDSCLPPSTGISQQPAPPSTPPFRPPSPPHSQHGETSNIQQEAAASQTPKTVCRPCSGCGRRIKVELREREIKDINLEETSNVSSAHPSVQDMTAITEQPNISKIPSQTTAQSQREIAPQRVPSASEELPSPIEDPFCTPNNPRVVSFDDIKVAAKELKNGIRNTPCVQSHFLKLTEIEIYLKKEFMQYTGSFKERGGRYALLTLSEEEKKKGVITASAGNHAQALCYHGAKLGIPVTVVMPTIAPIMKIQNCRGYGGNVIVKGNNMTESKLWAMHMGKEEGLMYLNGYDHPAVLAGQGSCGLEIVEQVPDVDAIVVPVGGGSLLSGVAVAVKTLKPHVQIIAAETDQVASFDKSMREGKPVATPLGTTLADGLAVSLVGFNSFATASPLVDKCVVVSEEWVALAILRLIEQEKCVVEGAGAVGLAAILSGQLDELIGKKVVLILSGGNIDTTVLGRVIDRGLAADGRLVTFAVNIMDRPGGLDELCAVVTSVGVSIKHVIMDRAWLTRDVFKVRTKFICETRDLAHSHELKETLDKTYKDVDFPDMPIPSKVLR